MPRGRVPWKSHKFSFNILADIVLITYRDTNANDIRHDDRMHPDDGVTENEPTHRHCNVQMEARKNQHFPAQLVC